MRHHMKRSHDAELRGFASDNYSGVHPEVLDALVEANGGHQIAYGEDEYTARLQDVIVQHFGEGASVWPMFNGTGANVVGLQSMLPRWGAVICADTAHIHVDEGGAPEKSAGIKLLPVPTGDGKLTPELIAAEAWGWGDEDANAQAAPPAFASKPKPPAMNDWVARPAAAARELTLREHYTITETPSSILEIIVQAVADAEALAQPK